LQHFQKDPLNYTAIVSQQHLSQAIYRNEHGSAQLSIMLKQKGTRGLKALKKLKITGKHVNCSESKVLKKCSG
jgi:hypothetical protein